MVLSLKLLRYFKVFFFLFLLELPATEQNQPVHTMVLGIAQDAGLPQVNCVRNCCNQIGEREKSDAFVASIAVADEEKFYMIDATPDFTAQFMLAKEQFGKKGFGGIFLTHAHIGHYTGLMYLGREAMAADSIPVYCMPRLKDFLESNGPWKQLVELGNIKLIELSADVWIELSEHLRIKPIPVPHRDEYSETVAYWIAAERQLFYVPDIDKWEVWDVAIEEVVQEVDYALLDGTFFDGDELPGRAISEVPHPFVKETLSRFSTLSQNERNKIHFIHLNHTNPLHNSKSEAYQRVESKGMHVAFKGQMIQL